MNWLDYLVAKQDLSVTNLDKDLRDGIVLTTILGMHNSSFLFFFFF